MESLDSTDYLTTRYSNFIVPIYRVIYFLVSPFSETTPFWILPFAIPRTVPAKWDGSISWKIWTPWNCWCLSVLCLWRFWRSISAPQSRSFCKNCTHIQYITLFIAFIFMNVSVYWNENLVLLSLSSAIFWKYLLGFPQACSPSPLTCEPCSIKYIHYEVIGGMYLFFILFAIF